MNKTIYLVRHCKAEGQAPEAVLTKEGVIQAEELAAFFAHKGVERIVASPFTRAIQSIEPLSASLGIKVEVDERLAERRLSSEDLPNWLESLEETFRDLDLTFAGGESSREAMDRIVKSTDEVLAGEAETIVVVTHGNIMTLLLMHYDERIGFDMWWDMSNPDVWWVSAGKVERVWG
ncbi:histidine phosphatase family protein [Paenalkalicoccus suaedae]|uniref:Histidine phosphatase family protein n=1 Tax=Paenalkalicoccus suaedae TaxID=2592382 RepID=A0A859FB12_9BACI|nr:histidine phosphatase family protein [Paenalkalicoccus suaedae]QKS69714.1 histidine phosphatase family protein [Paenalkalicoccus suaedae]